MTWAACRRALSWTPARSCCASACRARPTASACPLRFVLCLDLGEQRCFDPIPSQKLGLKLAQVTEPARFAASNTQELFAALASRAAAPATFRTTVLSGRKAPSSSTGAQAAWAWRAQVPERFQFCGVNASDWQANIQAQYERLAMLRSPLYGTPAAAAAPAAARSSGRVAQSLGSAPDGARAHSKGRALSERRALRVAHQVSSRCAPRTDECAELSEWRAPDPLMLARCKA